MSRLFIYCAGGHGRVTLVNARLTNEVNHEWDEICFVDDTPELRGQTMMGAKIMSFEDYLAGDPQPTDRFMIAAGETMTRVVLDEKLQKHGIQLGVIVNPDACIDSTIEIGPGTQILSHAFVGPNVKLGRCCLLQSLVTVGHDQTVGDYCTFEPNVWVGGATNIGTRTYFAPGSMVREGITIGDNTIIGMGSIVTKSMPSNVVVYGNPAKIVRENVTGKVFKK